MQGDINLFAKAGVPGFILKDAAFTVKSRVHNIMEKLVLHAGLEVAKYSYSTRDIKNIGG